MPLGPLQIQADANRWQFPKIMGTLLWGPYNKDPTIQGASPGSPIFGNLLMANLQEAPEVEKHEHHPPHTSPARGACGGGF